MPGEDGISLTRALREDVDTPILLLTAKSETDDRIRGARGRGRRLPRQALRAEGAPAPHQRDPAPRAAAQSPRTRVRRSSTSAPIRYDVERGELWRGDEPVRLTATEAQLMRIFAARPGEPVSREKLVGRPRPRRGRGAGARGRRPDHPASAQDRGRSRASRAICRRCAGRGYMLAGGLTTPGAADDHRASTGTTTA